MITVNGVDLRDLGFVASGRPQLPRLGGERTHVQAIPGRYGGVRMGGQVGDDTLSVTGHISAPDHATLLERIDHLARVLQGRSVIRLSDYPDREWVGYLQQGPSRASAIGPAWITRAENVVLSWTTPDPTARGKVEISQPSGALLLGTAPSPLRVEVQNGEVAPITKVTVEAFPNLLHNPGFEEGPAYWTTGANISYPYDPEGAYSGSRYLEITRSGGGSTTVFQLGGQGDLIEEGTGYRLFPLGPGDVAKFGAMARIAAGAGNCRLVYRRYDADRKYISAHATGIHSGSSWSHLAGQIAHAPGTAYISVALGLYDTTELTTARFDDVYLRIRRAGEPQRILEWNGSVAPGDLWECDTELFQVLNGGANALDGLTAASEFPVAEPGEGGYGNVIVNVEGGGGHTSTVRYRRRWL